MSMSLKLCFYLFLYPIFSFILPTSSTSLSNITASHLCHEYERLALLRFKESFILDETSVASSWEMNTDCCGWQGITCLPGTNHVIALDLSDGGLTGNLEPNNSLFHLHYLKSLNLAYNDFTFSRISPEFAAFSSLEHLNLSFSSFTGEVPLEIGQLSKLRTLDLSSNSLSFPNFRMIISNMTQLRALELSNTIFDSTVFPSIANLSSLTYLGLRNCELEEELPFDILNLPYLEYLNIGVNTDLFSNFPLYNWSSPLQYLDLSSVNFSSRLPSSPPAQAQYKLLKELVLPDCNFHGSIPSWMWNISSFETIILSNNHFTGMLGEFLLSSTIMNLQYLDLRSNNFTGSLNLYHMFYKLPRLGVVILSDNSLSVNTTRTDIILHDNLSTFSWPEIYVLGLSSCNLADIPEILQNQAYLQDLDLSNNKIQGEIPQWLYQVGKDYLKFLDLSHNSLSGTLPSNLPWNSLLSFDVSSNMLRGPLPMPSTTISWFGASNNSFTGAIDPSICDFTSISLIDLSSNSLSGDFPHCLGNLSDDLVVLNLRSNNIHGTLPLNFLKCQSLEFLDLSTNLLQGLIPRSLSSCTHLKLVNLGSNYLRDEFPYWLHKLPQIQVLDLSFNRLHGSIDGSRTEHGPFPMLQILDLSSNSFRGKLPATYIRSFKTMMNVSVYNGSGSPTYMIAPVSDSFRNGYTYSIVLSVGGAQRVYDRIITTLATFDLSNNAFHGEIPECVGHLVSIHSLNLSHNQLTGNIPPSLGNLALLNSLDLSSNMLTGSIPEELGSLTALGVFNVSENRLVGPIPHVNNFNTFSEDSYIGNLGLCGFPLLSCGEDGQLRAENDEADAENDSEDEGMLSEWTVILMGYGCGMIPGMAWGYYMLSIGKPVWLTKLAYMMALAAIRFSERLFGTGRTNARR